MEAILQDSKLALPLYVAGAVVSSWALFRAFRARSGPPLPPGPRPLPIIGNALDLPTSGCEWLAFSKLANKYGDIVYLTVLGRRIVLLSSSHAVEELLVKRSSNSANRPAFIMATECAKFQGLTTFLQYGDDLRKTRRMFHRVLSARPLQAFDSLVEQSTYRFAVQALAAPSDLPAHVKRHAGKIILKVTYDYDMQDNGDPLETVAVTAMQHFSKVTTPDWAVDFVPALRFLPKWLPGMGFLSAGEAMGKDVLRAFDEPFDDVKARTASGTKADSIVVTLLENQGTQGADMERSKYEDLIKYAAGTMYLGGSDTTVSSNLSFILAMAIFPEVQARGQAEVDALLKHERLPSLADRPSLPYLNGILWEAARWNPVGPLGVPHYIVEPETYKGYTIPAGTTLIGNAWHIMHDPKKYPDPMRFNPDRYTNGKEDRLPDGDIVNEDPRTYSFGYGRRECPGRLLADSSMWMVIATVLATCHVSEATHLDGVPITPETVKYLPGTVSYPQPFRCKIVPRSAKAKQLLDAAI